MADIPAYIPNKLVIDAVRKDASKYGVNVNKYCDPAILDFIKFIPQKDADALKSSYDRRLDSGTKMTPELDALNRKEIKFEKELLSKLLEEWKKKTKVKCP
jgi:hypothetical protein